MRSILSGRLEFGRIWTLVLSARVAPNVQRNKIGGAQEEGTSFTERDAHYCFHWPTGSPKVQPKGQTLCLPTLSHTGPLIPIGHTHLRRAPKMRLQIE